MRPLLLSSHYFATTTHQLSLLPIHTSPPHHPFWSRLSSHTPTLFLSTFSLAETRYSAPLLRNIEDTRQANKNNGKHPNNKRSTPLLFHQLIQKAGRSQHSVTLSTTLGTFLFHTWTLSALPAALAKRFFLKDENRQSEPKRFHNQTTVRTVADFVHFDRASFHSRLSSGSNIYLFIVLAALPPLFDRCRNLPLVF